MVGIVCDLSFKYHIMQENYFNIINNIFGDIKVIKNYIDLSDINLLFIADEMFGPNKQIWMNDKFIDCCNSNNIKVIVLNSEKIFNSFYPWNVDIQKNVEKFQNRLQLVYDPVDAKILNVDINKTYFSKNFSSMLDIESNKKNKMLFLGSRGQTYDRRNNVINEIVCKMPNDIDIITPSQNRNQIEYFNLLKSYKYILSPIGNHDGIPFRYYESLFVKSIPIQQIIFDTVDFVDDFDNSIFFKNVDEILNFKQQEKVEKIYYGEDFLLSILKKYNLK